MTKRKATIEEAIRFISKKIATDGIPVNRPHLQMIVDEIYPWSWQRYCSW